MDLTRWEDEMGGMTESGWKGGRGKDGGVGREGNEGNRYRARVETRPYFKEAQKAVVTTKERKLTVR
jgi:hypothetical protein